MRRKLNMLIIFIIFMISMPITVFGYDVAEDLDNMIDGDFFMNHSSVMLIIDVETGKIIEANNAAIDFYGYSHDDLLSMYIYEINTLTEEEVKLEIDNASSEKRNLFVFKHILKSGDIRTVEVYSYPFEVDGVRSLHSIIYDITEARRAEIRYDLSLMVLMTVLIISVIVFSVLTVITNKALKKEKKTKELLMISEADFESLFDNMHEGYALHEMIVNENNEYVDYRFLKINKSFEKYTGLVAADVIGKTALGVLPDIEKKWIEHYGKIAYEGATINFTNNSSYIGRHFTVHGYNAGYGRFITVLIDITETKEKQERIEYLSMHDQLTELYNRRVMEMEFDKLDVPNNLPISIIMADVNGLKMTNDAFGHDVGDLLLVEAAKTMKDLFRDDDIIARIGGDEFLILLPKTSKEVVVKMLDRLKKKLDEIIVGSINLSISFGDATKTNVSEDLQQVYKKAEDEMYRSKLIESNDLKNNMINAIMKDIKNRYIEVYDHCLRVGDISCDKVVEAFGLNDEDSKKLITASKFHDIGLVSVDVEILNKLGVLSEDDYKKIKQHPEKGYRILSSINEYSGAAEIVLAHHERWDGDGYPKNLKGEEIPYLSRILAVLDSYDAMINTKSYKKALSKEEAIEELIKCSDSQFDSKIVKIFIEKVI